MPITAREIIKTPGRCGGEACIRDLRIPVWSIVSYRREGATDRQILDAYPSLTIDDIVAAFDYANAHEMEIERAIWRNDAVMIDRGRNGAPIEAIRRGRDLGLTDAEICDAFEPALSPAELAAALTATATR